MILEQYKARKIIDIAKQAGFSPDRIVKAMYAKKIVPFRSDANLNTYIKKNQFVSDWAQSIADLVGKRNAELAAKIREEIIMQ